MSAPLRLLLSEFESWHDCEARDNRDGEAAVTLRVAINAIKSKLAALSAPAPAAVPSPAPPAVTLEQLLSIEWAGHYGVCPCCGEHQHRGHRSWCWIAAALTPPPTSGDAS